ncbi:MAG TPA: hypothetical protein VH478_19510 [Trebonia sp.]|nr:hypothetical protein [Trebonia sp.]
MSQAQPAAPAARTVIVTMQAVQAGQVVASRSRTLTFTSRQGLFPSPATRTGWLVNPQGTGLERSRY